VLCDRFLDSTRAYQGGAGGISDADILALHRIGSGGLLPDRTLLLDLPIEEGARRAAARSGSADRMGAKPASYFVRVADRFRALAQEDPDRFRIIPAVGAPDEVLGRLMTALDDLL
jgi:dTMP kinase